ncbi:MAG: alkaline phosphatase family protein [Gammaproteobacteria bacterium]|nr:MAG: alkaline phosphatase family protein [Gammaproteobacteria bacterium]
MSQPDYQGGSIVNLMATVVQGLGGASLGYAPLSMLEPVQLQNYRHIVLLVIDGLGHQYLCQAGQGGTLHAHLKDRISSVFPTTTATAITSLLTGLAPQQHGLTGWHTWFKELGCVLNVLPARPRLGGNGLRDAGLDVASLYDHVPVFDRIPVPGCTVAPKHIAHSDFNLALRGRAEIRAYESLEQMFELTARAVRVAEGRSYVYTYWPELDRIAHESGIGSEAASRHLAEIDAAFGRFLEHMAGSDTLVIVTADHGIIDSGKSYEIQLENHPALAETLTLPLCGERRAAYCYVKPDARDAFEDYVGRELAAYTELRSSRNLIAQNYFGLGEPHPGLRDRVGDYTLIMKENYVIKDWLFAERRYPQIGVHGGLSEQELYVPLILAPC